jgi:hypothetical protein
MMRNPTLSRSVILVLGTPRTHPKKKNSMISKEFFLFSEPVSGDDPPPQVVAPPPPLSSSLPRTGFSLPRTGSFRSSTARLIFPKSSSIQQQKQQQQQQSVETAPQPKPAQSRFGFKSTWGGANNSRNTSQTKPDHDVVAPPANGSRAASIKPAAIGRAASASQLPGRGGGGVASSAKGVESTKSSVTSSTLSRSTVSTSRLVSSKVVLSPKPITEEPPPRSSPKPGRSGNVFDGRNSPKLGQGESRSSPQNGRRDSPKDLLRNSPRFQRRGVSPSSSPTSSSKPGESHIQITCVRDPEPDLDPHVFGPPGSGSISQRY